MANNSHAGQERRINLLPYLVILPTAFFVAIFTVWPTILAVYQSFFRQRLNIARFRDPTFIGLDNYINLFTDDKFLQVLGNTLLYVIITVPVSVAVGFVFALLINRALRGIGLARLSFFYPAVLPMVSAATIWMFFFTPDYGIFNTGLRLIGYTGPQNWTANPDLALISIMIVAIWKNAGYYMIFYLAGLQGLPSDVFEAADLDGANWWQTLTRITFPLLRRTTLFISTIAVIGAFQTVDHIFVLTDGGPSRSSTLLLYELYFQRMENRDIGVSSAMTVILIAILLVFTVGNFMLSERQGE